MMAVTGINSTQNNTFNFDEESERELTKAFYLQNVFYQLIIPVISFIGLLGNVMTFVILWRKAVHPTLTLLLQALVLTDILIILLSLVTMSMLSHSMNSQGFSYFLYVVYPNIFTSCNFLIMTVQQLNVWITVAVSVERYIALCKPYMANKCRTKKNAIMYLITTALISVVYNTPRLFATETSVYYLEYAEMDVYEIMPTDFGSTHFYKSVFCVWMYGFIIYFVPILTLFCTSFPTVLELMRMRKMIIQRRKREINMSACIMLVVAFFIICQTPGIFSQIHYLYSPAVTIKLFTISNTLFVVNSSINFFIYTAAWRRFRNILRKTSSICRCIMNDNVTHVYAKDMNVKNNIVKCYNGKGIFTNSTDFKFIKPKTLRVKLINDSCI